jgi:hypothetical protein
MRGQLNEFSVSYFSIATESSATLSGPKKEATQINHIL